MVRTSYFEVTNAGRAPAPYLFFDQPYQFYCSERTYILPASRSYTAATGKWRDWSAVDMHPAKIDLGTSPNWKPDLHAAQLRAYELACAPSPRPKPRPGNRL